jgi:hypothetical protein
LSSSLVLVGSLTPTIAYAVQNAKAEPEEDKYEYTDADVVDTIHNLLINYDRYPIAKDDTEEDFNIQEKIADVQSLSSDNGSKVYALLQIGVALNIQLVD